MNYLDFELGRRVGLPAVLTALGWGLGLLLEGALFGSRTDLTGLATFGAVGGFTTGLALLFSNLPRPLTLRIAGGWAAACAAGWAITGGVGEAITNATGATVIGAIEWPFGRLVGWLLGWGVCGAIIGLTLRQVGVVQKRPALMVGGGWTLGGVLGWAFPQVAAPLLEVIGLAGSPVWDVLAGAVGSAVMFWQLTPARRA